MLGLTSKEWDLFLSYLRESFALLDRKDYLLRTGIPMDDDLKIKMELKGVMEREGLGL